MSKKWLSLLNEDVSEQHKDAVFKKVIPRLKAFQRAKIPWHLRWQIRIAVPIATLASILFIVRSDFKNLFLKTEEMLDIDEADQEFFENMELLSEIDIIDNLEVLEKWNPS